MVGVDHTPPRRVDIPAVAHLIGNAPQCRLARNERHVRHQRHIVPRRAALRQRGASTPATGGTVQHRCARRQPQQPTDRTRAVKRTLRSFQDLDRLHVVQTQRRIGAGGVELHVVQVDARSRLGRAIEAAVRDPANEHLVAAEPQLRALQDRELSSDLAEVGRRTIRAPRHAAHQRQTSRIAEQRHALLASGHDNIGGRRFGRWRRGRAGDRPRRWCRGRDDDAIAAGAARHGTKATTRQQAIERLLYRQRAAQLRRPHGMQPAFSTDDIDPRDARECNDGTVECHGRDGKGDAPLRRIG